MKMRSEPANLPNTRKHLLGIILKEHFFDVVICSVYVFVFAFPLLFWLIYIGFTDFVNITSENYLMNSLIINLPIMVGIIIFGFGIGGSLYYMKKLCFQEGSNVHQDFFKGIAKTFKQSLLSFFVIGLTYFLLNVARNMLVFGTDLNEYIKAILTGLMYVVLLIVIIFNSFIMTQSILYTATQAQLIMNAFRFFIGKFLLNIPIFLMMLLPFLIYEFVPFVIAHLIVIGISAIWHFGFNSLIFTLYSHHIFDLSINKNYPEIYRKGLKSE